MQLLLFLQLLSSCLAGPGDLEQALKLLQEQQATQRQQQEMQTQLLLMLQQQQQNMQNQQQQQMQMLLPPPFMQVQPMQLPPHPMQLPAQMPPQMQIPPQLPLPQFPPPIPFLNRPGGRLAGICSSRPFGPVAAPPRDLAPVPPVEEIEDEDDELEATPWFHCPKPLAPAPPSKEARTLIKEQSFYKDFLEILPRKAPSPRSPQMYLWTIKALIA